MDYSSNVSVNGPACSYASLQNYNGINGSGNYGKGNVGQPIVPPTTVLGTYIVPNFGGISYDALTHGSAPGCAGYFNIVGAYGKDAANCNTQFSQRLCNN